MQPLGTLRQPTHADRQLQPAERSPNPCLARPSNGIPPNEKFTLPRNAEEHEGESKIPNGDRKRELATQTERAAGRRKMQPGPGEAPPGDDPQRDRRNDTPAYTAEGNPTPKTLAEAVLQTKRASDDNVLTEGCEEEQLPWRREAQRASEACFCGGGGGARRTQCGEAKREGEWEGKEGKWGAIMERRGRMRLCEATRRGF